METARSTNSPRPLHAHRLLAAGMCGALIIGAATVAMTGTNDKPDAVASVETPPTDTTPAAPVDSATATTPATTPDQPTTIVQPSVDSTIPDAELASASSTTEVDGEDPAPEPGPVPEGLIPLDLPTGPMTDPTPFDPIAKPFTRIGTPAALPGPPAADPVFEPVQLPIDPIGNPESDPDPGELHLTAATGCANNCIGGATVTSVDGSTLRYELRIELDDPAAVDVYLSQAPLNEAVNGRMIPPFSEPTASGYAGSNWRMTFALEPATEYHVLIHATDGQGTSDASGSFTTLEAKGPQQLDAPRPCDDGCLRNFDVATTDDGTSLEVTVDATANATIHFAWSPHYVVLADGETSPKGTVTSMVEASPGTRAKLLLDGLAPNTERHVWITAVDSLGGTDTRYAPLATPFPVIYAGIDRVHISGDGDDGSLNKGEITFTFGTHEEYWGSWGEAKTPSNTTIDLGRESAQLLRPTHDDDYDSIHVYAGERDGRSRFACGSAWPDWWPEDVNEWCGDDERTAWSGVRSPSMTFDQINALDSCDGYNVANPAADRCLQVETLPNSSDQVSFEATYWFDIDPGA